MKPYLEKKSQKMAGGVAQEAGPEFKPQYCKKKKKKKERGKGKKGREGKEKKS
jgi:hypothetical protein